MRACLHGVLVSFVAALAGGCVSTDKTGYIFVNSTKSLEKLNRSRTDNVFPWERLDAKAMHDSSGDEMLLVSNSCGFVSVVYELAVEEGANSRLWNGRGQMGEWCHMDSYLLESESLVRFRNWHGTNYILDVAPVFTDGNGLPFVSLRSFIQSSDIEKLTKPIVDPQKGTGCFDPGEHWYARADEVGKVKDVEGKRCFSEGVYLEDMSLSACPTMRSADRRENAAPAERVR